MTTIDEPTSSSIQSTFVPPTPSVSEIVRRDLTSELGKKVLGDEVSRGLYATDASVYQFMPVAVVVPEDEEDIRKVLEVARKYHVPVLPRGGGTSLAGQTANHAIILDISKNMNRILEVKPDEKWVHVQPGLVRDELNAAMAEFGLEFGPETSTSDRANIGGMIGNNSSGMRSIRYGRTLESLLECRVMLPNGEIIECKPRTQAEIKELMEGDSEEGKIWRGLTHLLEHHRSLIEQKFPKVLRRVGGYSLDEFPEGEDWNLAKLMGGSEGTLGIILDAKLKLVETPKTIKMVAVHFEDLIDGLRSVPRLMEFNPLSAEVLDGAMIKLSKNNPSTAPLCDFVVGEPGLILQVEIDADTEEACIKKIDEFEAFLKDNNVGYAYPRFITKQQADRLLDLRKKGLGVSLSVPGDTKPVSWIEDACVPIEHLADYTERVLNAATERGLNTVIYGHASVGVLHIKPALNLKSKKGLADMAALSKTAMEYCREYGGSWSGEHGDGVARGAQNPEFWGPEMMEVFRQIKGLFDPVGLMNPARIINSPAVNENLRYGTEYKVKDSETIFHYRDFGGFAPAVEMCNGVGACRKTLSGTMCPSYMVTRDEQESTRGRANALRLAMSGQLDGGLSNERLHEVLDLCIECKACKSECPSNVDMARLKSDHLAKYYEKNGPSLRDRVFAQTPMLARLAAGPLAFFANAPMKIGPLRKVLLKTLKIAEKRNLPYFSPIKLQTWFKKRKPTDGKLGEVVLFADCWSNYNELAPGKWGIRLLEHLGYKVTLVGDACCQRTRISKGFLADAKRGGTETLKVLKPYVEKGLPILGIEPSCMSSLTDDLPDLVDDQYVDLAKKVAKQCYPIEAFLAKEVEAGRLEIPTPKRPAAKILVHGHCHQKAIYSTSPAKMLLGIGGTEVSEVDSGCCGMAGSFGYEAEHYEISEKMAERRLMPEVRKQDNDTIVVANGFSCRHQIKDFADKKAYHTIEALARQITGNWHTD